jgi:hypothetical protein
MRRARRTIARFTLVLFALTVVAVGPASADDAPSVRLFSVADHLDVHKDRRGQVYLDPGVWVASVGGAFELQASRSDYDSPVTFVQIDHQTGEVVRTLPPELAEGWSGLAHFIHVSVRDARGNLVARAKVPFCPNQYGRSRLGDDGPLNPTYPSFCGGSPFTLGTVFGIDDGWASPVFGDYYYGNGITFQAPGRHFTMTAWIDNTWAELLGVASEDASVTVDVTAITTRGDSNGVPSPPVPSETDRTLARSAAAVPETSEPPAAALPDLVALPAWSIQTLSRKSHDYLAFAATEWNAGPGVLDVEGFRRRNDAEMDAFQYFVVGGEAVARAPAGSMEYHAEHHHWHFEQFTQYSLIGASSGDVQISGKQSWCLANTDAIDLTRPGANWLASWTGDLFTQCGSQSAIWIREVLDVGWGDTYGQYLPGQAFDITDVPNGRYVIRVEVNPDGLLHETTTANNVQDRVIKLRGTPGNRTAIVESWHGIDDR